MTADLLCLLCSFNEYVLCYKASKIAEKDEDSVAVDVWTTFRGVRAITESFGELLLE